MGTKLKEKHHHAHWTLMPDKPHTPGTTESGAHKQAWGRAHTKGNRLFAPERAQSFGMCYQSATQCCRLSVFTGCSGNGYLILTLICSSFAISVSSGDTRLEKVFKLGREKQNRKSNFPSKPPHTSVKLECPQRPREANLFVRQNSHAPFITRV